MTTPDKPRLGTATPPSIAVRTNRTTVHGVELSDDYGWLRAPNWRQVLEDPECLPLEILTMLEAENAHAEAVMGPTEALQETLVAEMRGRMEEEDADVPVPDGPFEYYARYREDGQHELICRSPRGGGDETILIDGDALADGKSFFDLAAAVHSPDHGRVAWSADEKGSELHTIRVRVIESGTDMPDAVERADGEVVWTADGGGFYYVEVDDNHRASSVHLHKLGGPQAEDSLVYKEADPGWFVSIARSRSGRFMFINIHGHDAAEAHAVDLTAPEAPPLGHRTP